VRIVDAGGAVKPGRLFVAWAGELSPTRPADASPAEQVQKQREVEQQKHAAQERERQEKMRQEQARKAEVARKAREIPQQEIQSGRCERKRHAQIQQTVQGLSQWFKSLSDYRATYIFAAHETVIATPSGTEITLSAGLRGEIHFFAVAFDPIKLAVFDRRGNPIQTGSQYETMVKNVVGGGEVDSRMTIANTAEKFRVKVAGLGCALVVAVRKY